MNFSFSVQKHRCSSDQFARMRDAATSFALWAEQAVHGDCIRSGDTITLGPDGEVPIEYQPIQNNGDSTSSLGIGSA